mmetsp:Transcript_626/g.1007  ORF Transcript_626/g.1007 Transcript_626/m.1007 type:complete len:299 (-) Transcript_626:119-1015(-)
MNRQYKQSDQTERNGNTAAFPSDFLLHSPSSNESNSDTHATKDNETVQKDHETCNKYVSSALNRNVTVKFLMERLIGMGCEPPKGFINCIDCGTKYASGGFGVVEELEETKVIDSVGPKSTTKTSETKKTTYECSDTFILETLPKRIQRQKQQMEQNQRNSGDTKTITETKLRLLPEIFICQNHLVAEEHAHQSLVHELIHAIDLCRTKMDPINNCIHMSCTEIRAENLSGECNLMREMINGRISNFKGHGGECVKRRALLSVKANPNCKDRAEEYVDAAFDRCFKDTFPFDRHPNLR